MRNVSYGLSCEIILFGKNFIIAQQFRQKINTPLFFILDLKCSSIKLSFTHDPTIINISQVLFQLVLFDAKIVVFSIPKLLFT